MRFGRFVGLSWKSGNMRVQEKAAIKNGHAVGVLRLTPEGEKFVGTIFPKHAKVVKSLMRVLEGREQQTLSKLLRKLRKGDVVKFVQEIRMKEVD